MERLDTADGVATANTFGYNVRSEVTSAAMGNNTYSYGYDPIGNRVSATNNAEALAYCANALNQYTNLQSTAYSLQPSYDADGNMTSCAAETAPGVLVTNFLSWDAENRLVCVSNETTVVSNVYDHQSRRIRKEVYVRESPPVAYSLQSAASFLYDGWNVVREIRSQSSEVSTNYYTWGLDLSGTVQGAGGVGGLLAVTTYSACNNQPVTCNTYYPCYDANGNVTAYLDTTGGVALAFSYDPFGNTVAEIGNAAPGTVHLPHRFSTKYFDAETGMYDYGYRFYLPELMCFLNRDPITERGGLNLYGFVGNNPVNRWDLLGKISPDWAFAGDPNKPLETGYYFTYLAVYGPNGRMSLKWEYYATPCEKGDPVSESFGPRIYNGQDGYYPLFSTRHRGSDGNEEDVKGTGFGLDFLKSIFCYKGNITITIKDTGGEVVNGEKPPANPIIDAGSITDNFGQHATFVQGGELSGGALVITVDFNFCGEKPVYKVKANPEIPVKEKRKPYNG